MSSEHLKPFQYMVIDIDCHRVSIAEVMAAIRVLHPKGRIVITIDDKAASFEIFHDAPMGSP